jgi:hypothetical protein
MPHQHHTELEDALHSVDHNEATTILEYLQLVFHLDMGSDHLETFEKTGELTLAIPLVAAEVYYTPLLLQFPEKSASKVYFSYSDWHSSTAHFWIETSFRGPPTA